MVIDLGFTTVRVIVKTLRVDGNRPRKTCRVRGAEGRRREERRVRIGNTKVLRGTKKKRGSHEEVL